MKLLINKRKFLVLLLILTTVVWLVPGVFAAPQADGVVPTPTWTPTITLTPPLPTAPPPPTSTTVPPYPAAQTQAAQVPTATTEAASNDPGTSNVPETNATAAAAGSSVLGFLLCAGVIIVAGLAVLNVWSRRRP